jgi:hypothetical protein
MVTSLYSRALTTICVDEVPAPRSRPTTVRQGNGGLKSTTYRRVTVAFPVTPFMCTRRFRHGEQTSRGALTS